MNEFEKAEKLRERANVSFEEARDALKACGGDLLDAMVYLERLGHIKPSEETTEKASACNSNTSKTSACSTSKDTERTSTRYSSQNRANTGCSGNPEEPLGSSVCNVLKRIFQKTIDNELVVSQNGIEKFRVPVLVFILALCIFNFVTVIAMGVSLFFGVTYRFVGKDDLSQVNRAMSTVGGRATEWWESRNVSREVNDLCHKYDKNDDSEK
ncbi:MAG: hypothetical protein IJM27_01205 [Eubacterium sp.]|nr:hypothetical protein [Eubacterium sp.]